MENSLDLVKISVGVIVALTVISIALAITNRGKDLFNQNTDAVTNAISMAGSLKERIYDGNTVSTDLLRDATLKLTDYEVRYQTLEQKKTSGSVFVYPGTEQGSIASSFSVEDTYDKTKSQFINPDAKWESSIGNDGVDYIIFVQVG